MFDVWDTNRAPAGTFAGVFGSPAVDMATSDAAWLQAMLDVEGALARAGAAVGLVPESAADLISSACRAQFMELDEIVQGWAADATPVVALVDRIRELVQDEDDAGAGTGKGTGDGAGDIARYVHLAATSQDVIDTATSLVARNAFTAAAVDLAGAIAALAELTRAHRDTPQVGRTLLQQGAVTTFGAACAARLTAILEAMSALAVWVRERASVQLGGAVGTLGPAGDRGPDLIRELAHQLELAEPVTPWHTTRGRVAELAAAIGVLCGELAGVAQDVVLLSSTEIAEVRVASPGGSSAMPDKQNPAPAVLALACAHRVPGLVSTVLAGMPQELQRSAGRWQAEWATLTGLLRLLGGVARHTRACVTGLVVDADRMRAHVDTLLAGNPVDVGSAPAFVDRALARHSQVTGQQPR
jgi:3-carboxy-cis,cis-muconate cycloisomerase